MKVLILSLNFAPEMTGIGKYSGDLAAWLVEQQHEVRVVAAPPYYPQWKVQSGYRASRFRRDRWRGVDIWRAPLWVPKNPRGITRLLHLLSFAVTSFPLLLKQVFWAPQLVLCVAPAFVCAPGALLAARLCGARAWLHLQDFEVDVAFEMGLLKGRLLQRLARRMESLIMRRFDCVSTISHRMVELLIRKGVRIERTRYFPNWVSIPKFAAASGAPGYRERLGVADDAVIVLFSGTLAGKQGLMVIPEAARLMAGRTDVVFVICGEGIIKDELEAALVGLPNVRLMALQPSEHVVELLQTADIHLLPQSPAAADLVLPSKLSGMLASGRPIIATCHPDTEIAEIVASCGTVVPPNDAAALAQAIHRLADDPDTRKTLGRKAREYAVTHFEREAVLGRVLGPGEPSGATDITGSGIIRVR